MLFARMKLAPFYPALILAFAIGILIIAPAFYFRYFSSYYEGIDLFRADAETSYLAQIQEIYDGHYFLANPYTADDKAAPSLSRQLLTVWIVGGLGRVLGISAPDANLLAKFIFPFLLSLLVYAFLFELTERHLFSLLGAAFIMLIPATSSLFWPNWWPEILIRGNFPASDYQFLYYYRSINPQVSAFFFYGYLLLLWKFLYPKGREKLWGILSAIVLGLSFYTYFYVFSLNYAVSGLLFFWFLFKKDYDRAKRIFYLGLIGIIIGFPVIINLIQAMNSLLYLETAQRLGLLFGHNFIFSKVWWGAFLGLFVFWKKIPDEKFKLFIFVFLVAVFILTNQQIVTSSPVPAPQHYHWYYIAPLVGAFFIYLVLLIASKFMTPFFIHVTGFILLIIFFWVGILFQKKSYEIQINYVIPEQRYAPIFQWLNSHTEKDSVVLGNTAFSVLLVAYTHDNAYYHGGVANELIATSRLKDHLFVHLFWEGVTAESADAYFEKHREEIGKWLYGEYWRQFKGCSGCFPDEMLEELVTDYKNFLQADFLSRLKKYRLDYIVWDMQADPSWRVERFARRKLYEKNETSIWEI